MTIRRVDTSVALKVLKIIGCMSKVSNFRCIIALYVYYKNGECAPPVKSVNT